VVFGSEASGRESVQEGGILGNRITTLIKKNPDSSLILSAMQGHGNGPFILDAETSWTIRKKFCCL
jgi:hypothetical protein